MVPGVKTTGRFPFGVRILLLLNLAGGRLPLDAGLSEVSL